jgi:hypothetical protein
MLREVYGEVILKKGSILYTSSSDIYIYNKENQINNLPSGFLSKNILQEPENENPFQYVRKGLFGCKIPPMLFCVFHPDEFRSHQEIITSIELQKDISLFFMVKDIKDLSIISALPSLLNDENGSLTKMRDEKLLKFKDELIKENFDGWFSSIDIDKTKRINIEVYLINDSSIFRRKGNDKIYYNNKNLNLNKIIDINHKFKICCWLNPIIFNINIKFKNIIEKYIKYGFKYDYDKKHIFLILLKMLL